MTNVLVLHTALPLSKGDLADYQHCAYNLAVVTKLDDALALVEKNQYSLIAVEVMPPWKYADEPIVRLRSATQAPVLGLVRGRDTTNFQFCLNVAHVCVWEPFMSDEVISRVTDLLERAPLEQESAPHIKYIYCRGLLIVPGHYMVYVGKTPVRMARKEYATLLYLAQNRERLLTHEQIYTHVWKEDALYDADNAVSGQIHSIRRKLSKLTTEEYIETVWGMGYRFCSAGWG